MRPWLCLVILLTFVSRGSAQSEDDVRDALRRAATYYRERVAKHGGYVYYYSLDLQRRMGEGLAGPEENWVQPPGTPTVGLAYLAAYRATGDEYYLDAATETAQSLIYGQLHSGAWTNSVNFDVQARDLPRYRNGKGSRNGRNFSTLDDGISPTAIRFLIEADRAHRFSHKAIHESVDVALNALLQAQYPNGAFPQGWDDTPNEPPPIRTASYPTYDWHTEGRIKNYWDMYTLNDGVCGEVAETLSLAHQVYEDRRYLEALRRLGDFLILAQMPDPQPGWAQQYGYDMHPIWARKFEPPAVSGRESEDAIETLLKIYAVTGDEKYLAPIPRALDYLKRSLLPDGRLARYYELETNRPLYMSRRGDEYSLTHDDSQLPSHYGWKNAARIGELEKQYQQAKQGRPNKEPQAPAVPSAAEVRKILAALDSEGRWVSTFAGEPLVGQPKFRNGDQYLNSGVFSQHLETLSLFLPTREQAE